MDKKCFFLLWTRWAVGLSHLLLFLRLAAYSCGFFIFTQPHLEVLQEMCQIGLLIYFPKCLSSSASVADKVSNALWAFPRSHQYSLDGAQMVSIVSRHTFGHFCTFPSKEMYYLSLNNLSSNYPSRNDPFHMFWKSYVMTYPWTMRSFTFPNGSGWHWIKTIGMNFFSLSIHK